MNKTNLQTPRIRIEHLWPGMPEELKVGDILTATIWQQPLWLNPEICFVNKDGDFMIKEETVNAVIASGSNCIRSLFWWKYRELSELPEYLKCGTDGRIIKVKWDMPHGSLMVSNADFDSWDFMSYVSGEFKIEPSDLKAYTEYLKTIK